MRTAITGMTLLGLLLLALATTGINSIAAELETAAPKRVPAPDVEQVTAGFRPVDCPLRERKTDRRQL